MLFRSHHTGFPLQDVLGGALKEVKCLPTDFSVNYQNAPLPAHLWKGSIYNTQGQIVAQEGNNVLATRHRVKKKLEHSLEELHKGKKDNVVTFEELGVDKLFVDEAHSFKNLYLATKMRNVAGIGQSVALKSSDMFDCYLNFDVELAEAYTLPFN